MFMKFNNLIYYINIHFLCLNDLLTDKGLLNESLNLMFLFWNVSPFFPPNFHLHDIELSSFPFAIY